MSDVVTLPFLGERTYLHGTTLFDALRVRVPQGSAVVYKLSRLMETDTIEIVSGESVRKDTVTATFDWEISGGGKGRISVVPSAISGSPRRVPFDEEAISARARPVESDGLEFCGESPYSFISTLVPLNKALLNRRQSTPGKAKWLFTRIDLSKIPDAFESLFVRYEGELFGGRIVRSAVTVDDSHVGQIYFSRV